jgi:hypothetical protein
MWLFLGGKIYGDFGKTLQVALRERIPARVPGGGLSIADLNLVLNRLAEAPNTGDKKSSLYLIFKRVGTREIA